MAVSIFKVRALNFELMSNSMKHHDNKIYNTNISLNITFAEGHNMIITQIKKMGVSGQCVWPPNVRFLLICKKL